MADPVINNSLMSQPQAPPGELMAAPGGNRGNPPPRPPAAAAAGGKIPSSQEMKAARAHIDAIVSGLKGLVTRPKGDLTKKDVFDAASEMIAKGAFPTAESKQGLIGELANLPDDEMGLRKALGGLLMQTSATSDHLGVAEAHIARMGGQNGV